MRVTISTTISTLNEGARVFDAKMDQISEEIPAMLYFADNENLTGESYTALSNRIKQLDVPAARAQYAFLESFRSACSTDAGRVGGLPRSSSDCCDTAEFERKIAECESRIRSYWSLLDQRSDSDGDVVIDYNLRSKISTEQSRIRAYRRNIDEANKYDADSATFYNGAAGLEKLFSSAIASVNGYRSGKGYGDLSWVDGAEKAYKQAFDARTKRIMDDIYHDRKFDPEELERLLSRDSLTAEEAEALSRLYLAHIGEEGVADLFLKYGAALGGDDFTGAMKAVLQRSVELEYADGAKGVFDSKNNPDTAARFAGRMSRLLDPLMAGTSFAGPSEKIVFYLPTGDKVTYSVSSSAGANGRYNLTKNIDLAKGGLTSISAKASAGNGFQEEIKVAKDGYVWLGFSYGVIFDEHSSGKNSVYYGENVFQHKKAVKVSSSVSTTEGIFTSGADASIMVEHSGLPRGFSRRPIRVPDFEGVRVPAPKPVPALPTQGDVDASWQPTLKEIAIAGVVVAGIVAALVIAPYAAAGVATIAASAGGAGAGMFAVAGTAGGVAAGSSAAINSAAALGAAGVGAGLIFATQ